MPLTPKPEPQAPEDADLGEEKAQEGAPQEQPTTENDEENKSNWKDCYHGVYSFIFDKSSDYDTFMFMSDVLFTLCEGKYFFFFRSYWPMQNLHKSQMANPT